VSHACPIRLALAQGWEWHFLPRPALDFASHAGLFRRGKSRGRGF
jgi:hypothetical protein